MSDIKYEIVRKIGIARNCNWVDGRCTRDQDCGGGVKAVRYEDVRDVGFFLFAGG